MTKEAQDSPVYSAHCQQGRRHHSPARETLRPCRAKTSAQ